MTLRPSTAPQRVPLLSTVASALVTELVEFAAACHLDYATRLVADSVSASVCPPSVGGACALGTDVLEDRQEEFECFAASVTHLVFMLLAPEGDPDAPDIPTPRSYAEAIKGPYSSQWQAAMDAEMASWKSTGTYVDEVPPPGANIVSGMWIFKVKRPPGSPPSFKARYVARGFNDLLFATADTEALAHVKSELQKRHTCTDLAEIYAGARAAQELCWLTYLLTDLGEAPRSPPVLYVNNKAMLALCQEHGQEHRTKHISLRYVLARELQQRGQLCLAYVASQANTADVFTNALQPSNPSLFLHIDTSLPPFYVLMYVDDLVFTTAETKAMTLVKSELQKRQTYTDLDELRNYLRLQITQDRARGTITLNLSHMVHQVLQGFGFTYSSPQSTPLPTGHSLSAPPSDESLEPSGPYPEIVGYLMYLMTCTRPDLAYPLAILARYVAHGTHKKEQLDAAKRVLRYLCSTSGMGPVLGGRAPVVLIGHADASWVDDSAT
ncbi:unnamed protein product [Closterium sp. NIES-54]